MVDINLVLNAVNLSLYIIERPLLRLLHLYHHFLNLFELLETISLHLFKLALFLNEHAESCVFVTKESVLNSSFCVTVLSN
jgi:hypothetical protein